MDFFLKSKKRIALAIAAAATLVGAAFSVDDLFDLTKTEVYLMSHNINKDTVLEVTRTPLNITGDVTVSATITIQATNYLTSFKFYVGNDDNDDGTVEASEWTLKATGTIAEANGETVGTIGATTTSIFNDAYRIVMVDREMGMNYDQWGDTSLDYENP